jgi:hypothetical protein
VSPTRTAALVLAAVLAILLACGGDAYRADRIDRAACRGAKVAGWSVDTAVTREFTRYGDDNTRTDDWTGGDGTHSVRLPDGRTLWVADDSILDRVNQPPNPLGQPYAWRDTSGGRLPALTRNALLVMDAKGHLQQTLTSGGGSFFGEIPGLVKTWRWPLQAVVEPRSPGSVEKVVRVLMWVRAEGPPRYLYGLPVATEVATITLPDLRLESIVRTDDRSAVADPGRRVLYGTTAVTHDGFSYVFGGDDGRGQMPTRPSSRAYLARVPRGRLAEPAAWRYWNGHRWQPDPSAARPVLGDGGRRGVGSAFTVTRWKDSTWLMLTMDAGGPGATGLSTVASYWACSPTGPWHGPSGHLEPPPPADTTAVPGTAVYNPQLHLEFTDARGLLLSYDVNWLASPGASVEANVNRNVDLYRPGFLRLRLRLRQGRGRARSG